MTFVSLFTHTRAVLENARLTALLSSMVSQLVRQQWRCEVESAFSFKIITTQCHDKKGVPADKQGCPLPGAMPVQQQKNMAQPQAHTPTEGCTHIASRERFTPFPHPPPPPTHTERNIIAGWGVPATVDDPWPSPSLNTHKQTATGSSALVQTWMVLHTHTKNNNATKTKSTHHQEEEGSPIDHHHAHNSTQPTSHHGPL